MLCCVLVLGHQALTASFAKKLGDEEPSCVTLKSPHAKWQQQELWQDPTAANSITAELPDLPSPLAAAETCHV